MKNNLILGRLQPGYRFVRNMINRKMEYARHVLRGTSGLYISIDSIGLCEGKKKSGSTEKNMDGCSG